MQFRPAFQNHLIAALMALQAMWAAAATATDMTVVVDRRADSVELYFTLPAHQMPGLFDISASVIANPDGTVDFDPLRLGTFDIGDDMFADVTTLLNDRPVQFEAMSLMVHPQTSPLPLKTPLDGMISIAVCTVPTPTKPITLHDLQLYAGYITYDGEPGGTLSLRLPANIDAPMTVELLDYTDSVLTAVTQHVLTPDNPTLTLDAPPSQTLRGEFIALLMALLINAGFVGIATKVYRDGDDAGSTLKAA
ncbi:MAG: hypothetical protein AAGK92_10820 [Pseudomonadota bacterium]